MVERPGRRPPIRPGYFLGLDSFLVLFYFRKSNPLNAPYFRQPVRLLFPIAHYSFWQMHRHQHMRQIHHFGNFQISGQRTKRVSLIGSQAMFGF